MDGINRRLTFTIIVACLNRFLLASKHPIGDVYAKAVEALLIS